MSLSGVMTALVEHVGDVLVNDCGRDVPDRVLRYHGVLPHDCCTEKGTLAVHWEREYSSNEFPNATSTGAMPCPGTAVTVLVLRYVVCWPVPEVNAEGVTLIDSTWDTRAAALADVADCVQRALMRLSCDPDMTDDLVAALVEAAGRGKLRFLETTPIVPGGGCAGVQWRIYCGVRSAGNPS